MNLSSRFFFIVSLIISTQAHSDYTDFSRGVSRDLTLELNSLLSTIEHQYGPLEMKAQAVNLNWPAVKEKYRARVKDLKSDNEYYFAITDLLSEFNDAHVSVNLPSSLTYTLPLQFTYVKGRTLLNWINLGDYPKEVKKPAIGDYLVAINGVKLSEFQAKYAVFNKHGNSQTNAAIFARTITNLSEARGFPLSTFPQEVKLTFKDYTSHKNYDVDLKYEKSGVGMIDRPVETFSADFEKTKNTFLEPMNAFLSQQGFPKLERSQIESLEHVELVFNKFHHLFNLMAEVPLAQAQPEKGKTEGAQVSLGHQKPLYPLPKDFKEIIPSWGMGALLNSGNFFAGTFKSGGQRVGLLRIPSYMPSMPLTMSMSVRFYIAQLEKLSDVLIIDQFNNPGGAVVLSDLLIKGLVGKLDPDKHIKFAVKPSQAFLRNYAEILELLRDDKSGILDLKQKGAFIEAFKSEYDKIYTAFNKNLNLSEPISLSIISEFFELYLDSAIKKMAPAIVRLFNFMLGVNVFADQVYSKPVFFLVNELDFSGGDATPASFQDYERGPVVGIRTAGAGGTVEEFSHRDSTEFKYRLTTSLMVRKGDRLVENRGVKPDIKFAITEGDYIDGFKDFLERLFMSIGI